MSVFGDLLKGARIQVQQRSTRGRELMAACGQLGAKRRPDRFAGVAVGVKDG
jgi:adenine C2-methylase RlmN of 23S rRNA A2503 and tRNA A37